MVLTVSLLLEKNGKFVRVKKQVIGKSYSVEVVVDSDNNLDVTNYVFCSRNECDKFFVCKKDEFYNMGYK